MLTALAADDRTVVHRRVVARFAQQVRHQTLGHDLLDQFAELAHAADAAARRMALAS